MQNESTNEQLILLKKNHQALLLKQLEAAYTQLGTTLNAFEKPSIQQTINNLEEEIKKLEDEINLLANQSEMARVSQIPQELAPLKTNINLQLFDFEVASISVKFKSFIDKLLSSQPLTIRKSPQQAWNFIENLGNGVQLEMVQIPKGSFLMGSPKNELERTDDEGPQHQVTVPAFFMGKYPVTQAQWKTVANLPQVNRKLYPDPSRFKGANRPVEQVSWYDAVEFCARLSQKTGKIYRLPSEAEWEYACRARTTTPFYFGETITTDLASYNGNHTYAAGTKGIYRQETTSVGSFGVANAFGLYDMHGNVWEWCADPWHDSYQGAPADGTVWDNNCNDNRYKNHVELLVNTEGDNQTRLLRGGSWIHDPRFCRSAFRSRNAPDDCNTNSGFRVVCVAA
ncbi:SUMF1/EgtB/PvdO family nonheme iron enzyme [Microcoleus sp. herbarium13]|uniref:SUMF1/EgtB/PvdO family nonheme iron enzyme n=1 Tax=unclassified Microcoleus TaxID=2642155 RepID=UPI003FA5C891